MFCKEMINGEKWEMCGSLVGSRDPEASKRFPKKLKGVPNQNGHIRKKVGEKDKCLDNEMRRIRERD